MGDVAAIYTATGTLVGTYEYDPYGRLLSETSNLAFDDSENILHKNPFRYRGYYYDSETGWYYLQSRYYDPEVKRFINADSTNLLTTGCSNLMQYNLFMYCNGDPINQKDEYGHMPYLLFAVAVGAVSGFIGQCFTDIVAYAKSGGEYQFSPEAYAGAIVGGAAGGAALALSGDPTIANFVTGAATTATTQLLEKATGKNDRSYAEIALNAGFDGTASAVLGAISFGNPLSNTVESAQNNYIAQLRAANPSLGPRLGEIGYDLTLDEIDGAVKTSISSGLRLDLYYGFKPCD
ncbi:MAG: RHS repeat-associated core domain-containing protein [Lachnospiraceae bacterium]|nr:RHS repeat-associated core domain-containing protein [Lachnospiraceae bacterium]